MTLQETVAPIPEAASLGGRPVEGGRRRSASWLGAVPLIAYLGLFLLLPTVIVAVGAFQDPHSGGFTLSNLSTLTQSFILKALFNSLLVSLASAVIGAVLGAVLAYAVASGPADGWLRRIVTSASGVLAQFGGVTLAFAFLSTAGSQGLVTLFLRNLGVDVNAAWLYKVSGLIVVYLYFQIPLMLLVFLPSLDGIRPQWREASETLGGSTWQYWRYVALPILTPSFLAATLLLFANAFAAYATAAALISQGGVIIPLQISNYMNSEVGSAQANVAKTLALAMMVIVAIAMSLYALMQRRSAKWLR